MLQTNHGLRSLLRVDTLHGVGTGWRCCQLHLRREQDARIIPGHNGNLAMMHIMDDYHFMHFRNPLDSKQARKVFLDDRDHVK